jgi:hypothetical protein
MRTKIFFLSIILTLFSADVFAQKQSAAAFVREFYRFHLSHDSIFNDREVARRRRFFTPRLRGMFDAELRREKAYLRKYPDNKPFFGDGLPFTPIEFCRKDYRVGRAQTGKRATLVNVHLVYSRSSCDVDDRTKLLYKIVLVKIGGKWLIDDLIYDDGKTLTDAFNIAKKIK